MILNAVSAGELAHALGSKGVRGKVTCTFRNSAYLQSKRGLILLLRGELRSPMTINLGASPDFLGALAVDEKFEFSGKTLRIGDVEVKIGGAPVFRSSIVKARPVAPIAKSEASRSAAALKLLYSASESSPGLANGKAFIDFADTVLRPLAHGRFERAYAFGSYSELIGNGQGFTPAGDDFVGGFAALFNLFARGTRRRKISLPLIELRKRTVSESALLVDYAQRGYVDEGLESLIVAGLGGESAQFRAQLPALASRGHTSGLDMSLGVLMSVASLGEYVRHDGTLESVLAAISS